MIPHLDWPGAAQVIKVKRITRRGGKQSCDRAYFITSIPPSQSKPAELQSWIRGHWGIENRLHYVRDVTCREDASRIRTGSAPQIFAALRNAAISFFRSQKQTNIAQAFRTCNHQSQRILNSLARLDL